MSIIHKWHFGLVVQHIAKLHISGIARGVENHKSFTAPDRAM